jgi:hypothetical protein
MSAKTLLALLCLLSLCACHAPGAPALTSPTTIQAVSTKALSTTTPTVPAPAPAAPIAVYVSQPVETAVTPKWNRTQASCEGNPFNMWGSPGTYLYQLDGAFFTIVLKPGEAIPKMGVSIPYPLSVAGIEDVTTGLGTFQATHLGGGGAYSILTGRLDSVRGTCQRHEWYVCGYGLVKVTSSDSGVKAPGNNSYSTGQDFVLVSFTPLTTNEAHVRYILADIQFGNVAGYYRANITDEETAEALRRWDAGVRVVNGEGFERRIVNGRWYIVYAGTERPVNGMDISLSSDPQR